MSVFDINHTHLPHCWGYEYVIQRILTRHEEVRGKVDLWFIGHNDTVYFYHEKDRMVYQYHYSEYGYSDYDSLTSLLSGVIKCTKIPEEMIEVINGLKALSWPVIPGYCIDPFTKCWVIFFSNALDRPDLKFHFNKDGVRSSYSDDESNEFPAINVYQLLTEVLEYYSIEYYYWLKEHEDNALTLRFIPHACNDELKAIINYGNDVSSNNVSVEIPIAGKKNTVTWIGNHRSYTEKLLFLSIVLVFNEMKKERDGSLEENYAREVVDRLHQSVINQTYNVDLYSCLPNETMEKVRTRYDELVAYMR